MIEHYLKYIPEEEHKAFMDCFTYQTVNTLNELLQLDPQLISTLCDIRLPCSQELGAQAFITDIGNNSYQTGVLGIINAILPSTTKVLPAYISLPSAVGNRTTLQLFLPKDLENGKSEDQNENESESN